MQRPNEQSDNSLAIKPLLRWAGSKRKLLPILLPHLPQHFSRYIEPFAGSACLFFSLPRTAAILGDLNTDIALFYRVLKKSPDEIDRRIRELGTSPSEYYRIRTLYNESSDKLERAVYFLYLNRMCFNGVYRTNRLGEFNVPCGSRTGKIPDSSHIKQCAVRLKKAQIVSGDFEDTCKLAKKTDFVYLDPPYATSSRPHYGEYGYGAFESRELPRLVSVLEELSCKGVSFLLSYSDTKESRKLFRRWHQTKIEAHRHIAGFAAHRRTVKELLISNYH